MTVGPGNVEEAPDATHRDGDGPCSSGGGEEDAGGVSSSAAAPAGATDGLAPLSTTIAAPPAEPATAPEPATPTHRPSGIFQDVCDTIQDLANAMVDPFELTKEEVEGASSAAARQPSQTQLATPAAGREAAASADQLWRLQQGSLVGEGFEDDATPSAAAAAAAAVAAVAAAAAAGMDGGGQDGMMSDAGDLDFDNFHFGEIGPLFPTQRALRLRPALLAGGLPFQLPLPLPLQLTPQATLFRDKVAFVLGLGLTWTMAYWLGWSPSNFYLWVSSMIDCSGLYTGLTMLLGVVRWVQYRSKRWHYYMLDFCYMANLLLLLHCWALPRSRALGKITFAFNTGPLSWSILAFRNSLVLHSLDKVTSVYMHLAPALVSWTLRWQPDEARFGPQEPAAGFWDLVALPIPVYVVWAVAYYLKIFVISAERIRVRGYATLFTYVANTEKKGLYSAIARRVAPALRPPVYLLLHLLFCCVTMAVSVGAWRSRAFHTLLLGAACLLCSWHGASYYFEFFSRRYQADLEARFREAAGGGGGGGVGGGGGGLGGGGPVAAAQHEQQQKQKAS